MQEKMNTNLKEESKASKEEMKDEMRAWRKVMKTCREVMMEACLQKTEATDLEAKSKRNSV
jgi:hypothetical protein